MAGLSASELTPLTIFPGDTIEAVHDVLSGVREEIVPESPLSGCTSPPLHVPNRDSPSTLVVDLTSPPCPAAPTPDPATHLASEEVAENPGGHEIIDLVSTQEDDEEKLSGTVAPVVPEVQPSRDKEVVHVATSSVKEGLYVGTAMADIPNRYARAKIRHQGKDRLGVRKRSRKRRDQAKCAITRSGSKVHHARTVKGVSIKQQLRSPEIKERLDNLRARQLIFPQVPSVSAKLQVEEVPWPEGIDVIKECQSNGVVFPDIGAFDKCQCVYDCFIDVCTNVASATFCTPSCCRLGARCSNAPQTLKTLKLYDTKRVGLGVYTTTALDVGDVIGESCGELSELPAVVDGQPDQAVQQNSGYTLLYNTKSVKRNYVYVDALTCSSITRFISHACCPTAAFVEQQNRSNGKVLVKMIENVKAGAQITVHYGKERWFRCACDVCWSKDDNKKEQ